VTVRPDDPLRLRRLSKVEKFKLGISDSAGGGFSPGGTPDGTKFLRDDTTWAAVPGAGGGDSITIAGVALVDANFNATTPAAPAGALNAVFAKDAASPAQVAASILTDNTSLEVSASKLRRAALTGDVTAAAGANATTIKNDVALAGNPTTTTQAANNNSTRIATTAYVNAVATGTNTGDVTLAGAPTYITIAGQVITRGAVNLASEVTGDLPFANLVPATAISKLVGRGQAIGAGDFEEITLGTNLSMTGTTLNAAGGGGTPPTGSGVYGVTAGVMDAAAVTVGSGLTKAAGDLHVDTAVVETIARRDSANGYCPLDAASMVPTVNMADTGVGSSATFLRGDRVWIAPPAGSASATTVEVNLGSTAVTNGKFTITSASIGTTSKVLAWQCPGPYTGKGTRADEAEMQPVQVIAVEPAAGSAVVKWQTPPMIIETLAEMRGYTSTVTPTTNINRDIMTLAKRIGKVRGNVKFTYTVFA
jgi:hypothetical protein